MYNYCHLPWSLWQSYKLNTYHTGILLITSKNSSSANINIAQQLKALNTNKNPPSFPLELTQVRAALLVIPSKQNKPYTANKQVTSQQLLLPQHEKS